jgi:2-amino-4-hydroxy-6-hydroxymethyldihydropteridine diphosphokinase
VVAPVTAYVGLGANLDDPVAQLRRAFGELAQLADTRVTARSPLYKSAPLGPRDQPDFINAAARLETRLAPLALLTALQAVESAHGRRRDGLRWGPRSLDLDLLLYGDLTLATAALTLPHPGLRERAFVLYPLADIAADLNIPGGGSVEALRDALAATRIRRLEDELHG